MHDKRAAATAAATAAERNRKKTGQGVHVDLLQRKAKIDHTTMCNGSNLLTQLQSIATAHPVPKGVLNSAGCEWL